MDECPGYSLNEIMQHSEMSLRKAAEKNNNLPIQVGGFGVNVPSLEHFSVAVPFMV